MDGYQEARDNLPDSLAETAYVEKLDAILELTRVGRNTGGRRPSERVWSLLIWAQCRYIPISVGHADHRTVHKYPLPHMIGLTMNQAISSSNSDFGNCRWVVDLNVCQPDDRRIEMIRLVGLPMFSRIIETWLKLISPEACILEQHDTTRIRFHTKSFGTTIRVHVRWPNGDANFSTTPRLAVPTGMRAPKAT